VHQPLSTGGSGVERTSWGEILLGIGTRCAFRGISGDMGMHSHVGPGFRQAFRDDATGLH
jgi:hypothetical protein